jgi:hypothetical protein
MRPLVRVAGFALVVVMLLATRMGLGGVGLSPKHWTIWMPLAAIACALRPSTFARHGRPAASPSSLARLIDLFVAGVLFSAAANGLLSPSPVAR